MNQLFHRALAGVKIYSNHFVFKKTPTIVYAPGRVGSMSMILALQKAGVYSFKVENFTHEKWGAVQFCKTHVIDAQKPAQIISLVRDPIEMLSSFFFSKAARGHVPLGHTALLKKDAALLHEAFEKEILAADHLHYFLNWFDHEFATHTGIDVYEHAFDARAGFGLIKHDTYPTLIMKTKLENSQKETLVKDFLNLKDFSLENLNVRATRSNGELYNTFKKTLTIPHHYQAAIDNSKYMRHFFDS